METVYSNKLSLGVGPIINGFPLYYASEISAVEGQMRLRVNEE